MYNLVVIVFAFLDNCKQTCSAHTLHVDVKLHRIITESKRECLCYDEDVNSGMGEIFVDLFVIISEQMCT